MRNVADDSITQIVLSEIEPWATSLRGRSGCGRKFEFVDAIAALDSTALRCLAQQGARLQASCIDGCSDSETALVAIRSSYAL